QQAAKEWFIRRLSDGYINNALNIKEKFDIPEEFLLSAEVQQAAKEGFIKCLSKRYIDEAIKIKEKFSLPEDVVQQAAKEWFIRRLSDGYIDNALYIKEAFSISIKSEEIITALPVIGEMLERLKEISPRFYEQAHRSVDIVLSLVEFIKNPETLFSTIEENPFLMEAISQNPRFGSKLLLHYPQFDNLSKENISTLFAFKEEILKENPDISSESLEFRRLMQEKLKEYGSNPDIIRAIEQSGVNADAWLHYSETAYFNLESGEGTLAFSETIATPIGRIKETINSYAHTIKETLREYKKELSEFKILLEEPKEIEGQISNMQAELEKARLEGNEKKAQGIEKGILGLTKKLESIKTVVLWDKLLGDISAFQRLTDDLSGTQERLMQVENDFHEKLSGKMPSGKAIQELKEKMNRTKEELRTKFGVLERRIEDFQNNLPRLISPALGKERSEALAQEIQTHLAEQFDHWNTDRRDLTNLFSERSDKEKEKMANQPMSIFVWARNPDIDLYQGNYSPCCICIDSGHMGSESTIADYHTDVGVQIVNIWDETKNEPVTAAWCWLGEDKKGNAVLVVDNIESNTLYSANYSEQMTKKLFGYLEGYAKSIGVKKIVLGKANNDLPTGGELAKLKEDAGAYEKIGGYNRADGYFLEAEGKSVKVVWEKTKKEKETERARENQPRVVFEEIITKDLSENDFGTVRRLEREIYAGTDLIAGQALTEDIKSRNGLDYSIIISGKRSGVEKEEIIGYIVAVDGETDEGDACVYLEDIAVTPDAQGQKIGWEILKKLIEKLKEKARKENKPVLLDMHLRENSQRFMEKHRDDMDQMGVKMIEEALVPDYYDEGVDALYSVYQIAVN
ncbi:MAG: GNAT family N-acetyltransferase, partial [Patescibacteria group bacterium]